MRRVILVACCILSLAIPVVAQTRRAQPPAAAAPSPLYQRPVVATRPYQHTWYDAMLQQFNPDNLDWGQWLEQRREQFLEQTVANPYFKYSMVTTLLLLVLSVAFAKALIDKSRITWLAQERYEDVLRQDAISRKEAHAAIRRYNEHVEKCNRVIEAELATRRDMPAQLSPEAGDAASDQKLLALADMQRQCAALNTQLERSNAVIADLTVRVGEKETVYNPQSRPNGQDAPAVAGSGELMRTISELQQQLYRERERNKRLKGA